VNPIASSSALHRARTALDNPLVVTHANRRIFPTGPVSQDEIVTTTRLILVLQGELQYTLEGRTTRLRAGTQFLVPAWVRRVSSVSRGGRCELIWCEFDQDASEDGEHGLYRRRLRGPVLTRETRGHHRLGRLFLSATGPNGGWRRLEVESELKTMLVRFWEDAEPMEGGSREAFAVHPRVKAALRWAAVHFGEPDALAGLYGVAGLSRNYLRGLFEQAMACTPHDHLERLRLRHARWLLRTTNRPLKQIAAAVGYEDSLYFSRIYRRFWSYPPREERRGRGKGD